MTGRQAVLFVLTGAVAFAAALLFRTATHPGQLHHPVHAEVFERMAADLPALAALRVRSPRPQAAHVLATAPGAGRLKVLDPAAAGAVFRYGRLLHAGPDEVRATLDRLRRGEPPEPLPPVPDLSDFFRDAAGPYTCDVVVTGPDDVALVRAVLPESRLSGEPVVRADEAEKGRALRRALMLSFIAVAGWTAWRRGGGETLRRLLAGLLPVVVLGLNGWGIDAWTLPALVLVAGARNGVSMLCGAPCLFFPSLALKRLGVVFLVGGLARVRPWLGAGRRGTGRVWIAAAALLALVAALALGRAPLRARPHPAVAREPAAALLPPSHAARVRAELDAAGHERLAGGTVPLPPRPDVATRRRLRKIFELASMRERGAPPGEREPYTRLKEAAAVDHLYLPAALRSRVRAPDGRVAVWVLDARDPGRLEFTGARLHRARGERQLRREARIAAVASLCLMAVALGLRRGDRAMAPLVVRGVGVAAGFALLGFGEALGARPGADVYLPILVAAAASPSLAPVLALAGAALVAPATYLWPVAALALATAATWLVRDPGEPPPALARTTS